MVATVQACASPECYNSVPSPSEDLLRIFPNIKILCDECDLKRIEKLKQEQAAEEQERRQEAFNTICPPIYRESDSKRIPAAFLRECEAWEFSPQGLGFVGPAGTCKTRAAWMLLKRLHFSGVRVFGITATGFAKACADQWHDDPQAKALAEDTLTRCRRTKVLLLDDLGKNKFTERAELELFDLLEHRSSHELPIIWTANAGREPLKQMLSPDRGEPILRRLSEFTKVVREDGK
jgi:DNA replication protein DnaC